MLFLYRILPQRILAALATGLFSTALAQAQSDPLVSKSIAHLFADTDQVFAFGDTSLRSFSRIDFFKDPPQVVNKSLPFAGGVDGGARWRQSIVLRSNAWVSDTVHTGRVSTLFYDGGISGSDSLAFPLPAQNPGTAAVGAAFTAIATWHDTLVLGCGRLGIARLKLSTETDPKVFAASVVGFGGLPTGKDTVTSLLTCNWNATCRVDTVHAPGVGLDSVLSVAVDSSSPDSVWLLIGTQSGLRRGLLGGNSFPRIGLPGISDSAGIGVVQLKANPQRHILWAFTGARFFVSQNHGATFSVPPALAGLQTTPALLTGYTSVPLAAWAGDSTFINFNLDRPGLVLFRNDSLQRNAGAGQISDVLLDAEDSLNLVRGEGSFTELEVARNAAGEALLAVGTTARGIFYRKLDSSSIAFANLNRLRAVQGSLHEVITYPTLFSGDVVNGVPQTVHIGYHLKKDGKVTITVFNYGMEKVATLVRNAPRKGGQARSENPAEDRWDGRDASGRRVSVGTYYILVESDQGEKGFGKALVVRGRE